MFLAAVSIVLAGFTQASQPEAVLIEVRIGRLASATVQGYRVRSEVLLPVSQVFQLAEIQSRLSPEAYLAATLQPGDRRIVIDPHSDTMLVGEHRVRLEPEFRRFEGGELYVGSERLGDLLGVVFAVDWTELTATVVNAAELPVAQRLRREAAREVYLRSTGGAPADVTLNLQRPKWGGVVVDYSLFTPIDQGNDPLGSSTYGVGLGADVGGGSLELLAQSIGPAQQGQARVAGSWTGVWRDQRWLKQLRVGDIPSSGPPTHARALRGIAITNAPFVRPSVVGSLRYTGSLDPGWSVEAYRSGDLVAFDSVDNVGGFAIDLPVHYGENPVDFVAYGPFGERRMFNRTYRVLADVLPAGQFEYGVSGGRCPETGSACRATANLDLRYGASRRWTVQGGLDQFWRDAFPDRLHPYAAFVANPSNAWAAEGDLVAGALARGMLRFEPTVDLRLVGEYVHFASDSQPVLMTRGRSAQWALDAFVRPRTASDYLYFEGRVEQIRSNDASITRARLGASIQTTRVRLLPYVRSERGLDAREFVGFGAFVLPQPTWGRLLRRVLVRATTEVERQDGLASWSAFASGPIAAGTWLEVGANWRRGESAPTFLLTLTATLSAIRSVTALAAPPAPPGAGSAVRGSQFFQGSVLWDPRSRRLSAAPGPSLEQAGLSGSVFLDQNANGIRDPGEPGLGNARVLAGSQTARTDSAGQYHVWTLVPFEPVVVSLDSMSLESPLLVPLFARTSIVPGPNRYRSLDIPVVEAGVIEGRVTRDGAGIAGVTLILLDRRRNTRRAIVTFSDGSFYAMGVKPGDYELSIPVNVLDALGVHAEALRFTLTPAAAEMGRSDLELRLTPRP